MSYSEKYLEVRRENGFYRLYAYPDGTYRTYHGHNIAYQGNDHGAAYRIYNGKEA